MHGRVNVPGRNKAALAAAAAVALAGAAVGARAQDMKSDSEIARRAVNVCASCHGDGGASTNPLYPKLAGQSAQYVAQQLKDFRDQTRAEAMHGKGDPRAYMWGISSLLDDRTIQALADYYAEQPVPPSAGSRASRAVLARGKAIFDKGIPARDVRACASCHGEKAEGAAGFPRLAGQHAAYLESQLHGFGTRLRPHGVLMKNEVAGMRKDELRAVAQYLASM